MPIIIRNQNLVANEMSVRQFAQEFIEDLYENREQELVDWLTDSFKYVFREGIPHITSVDNDAQTVVLTSMYTDPYSGEHFEFVVADFDELGADPEDQGDMYWLRDFCYEFNHEIHRFMCDLEDDGTLGEHPSDLGYEELFG